MDWRWWPGTESNRRRQPFQGCALPAELPGRKIVNGARRKFKATKYDLEGSNRLYCTTPPCISPNPRCARGLAPRPPWVRCEPAVSRGVPRPGPATSSAAVKPTVAGSRLLTVLCGSGLKRNATRRLPTGRQAFPDGALFLLPRYCAERWRRWFQPGRARSAGAPAESCYCTVAHIAKTRTWILFTGSGLCTVTAQPTGV